MPTGSDTEVREKMQDLADSLDKGGKNLSDFIKMPAININVVNNNTNTLTTGGNRDGERPVSPCPYRAPRSCSEYAGLEIFVSAPAVEIPHEEILSKATCSGKFPASMEVATAIHQKTNHERIGLELEGDIKLHCLSKTNYLLHLLTLGALKYRVNVTLKSVVGARLVKIHRGLRFFKTNKFKVKSPHNDNLVIGYIRRTRKLEDLFMTNYTLENEKKEPILEFKIWRKLGMTCPTGCSRWFHKGKFYDVESGKVVGRYKRDNLSINTACPENAPIRILMASTCLIYNFI